ncbi:hypothetical protein M3649_03970 [Ureibacillus chungkukjangi]|uniref:hypothetical protein n=1 Tax=Ureibacillus chungkukjangi TaxID=1202712 RepID=UPI00203F263A|nr:hypothetical protein [Ureibacillus chungkukjangi]MCM3387289.1 hypothetical protein [Ureibacillus chungkukjangi]
MNRKFKLDQKVVCTFGSNKGKEFIVKLIVSDGYSCQLANENDGKYYRYTDSTLIAV